MHAAKHELFTGKMVNTILMYICASFTHMKKRFLFALLFSVHGIVFGQEFENRSPSRQQIHDTDIALLSPTQILEDSLVFFADSMYFSALDESRISGGYEFLRVFKKLIKSTTSFSAPLTKLKEKISILSAPDNSFKIYNWEIVRSPAVRRYYGAIQTNQGEVFPLVDVSDQILRGLEDSIFSNVRWYGCLYYNILQKKINDQSVYFLLGWNGNSLNSEKKIIEAFGYNNKGQCVFGAPVFNVIDRGKRKQSNRFVVEYQKAAKVSLNYDKEYDQIILDHCESQIGDPAKKYTYIPDGTYDGLQWDNNQWVMRENAIEITELKEGEAPLDKPILKN